MVDGYPPPDIAMPIGVAEPPAKYYIKGKPVTVLTACVEYLDHNGKLVTETLCDYSRKAIVSSRESIWRQRMKRPWRACSAQDTKRHGCFWHGWLDDQRRSLLGTPWRCCGF